MEEKRFKYKLRGSLSGKNGSSKTPSVATQVHNRVSNALSQP